MIFSYTFTDTLISNCISSRNIFTFPTNVVNPPLAPATSHSLRCLAHRATDLNPNPDLNSKLRDVRVRNTIQRSSCQIAAIDGRKDDFGEPTFPKYEQRVSCESLLRKHDTHRAVYLRITSATLSPEFSSRPGEPSRGEQTSLRIEAMMRRISASPKIVLFRRYLLIFVKSSRPDNTFCSFNNK